MILSISTFKPRLTKPEKGNKYYITVSAGGYSRAIVGKPTDPDCNVLSNCVGYAYGRFQEIQNNTKMNCFDPVNAENIYANAIAHGMKTGSTPKLGAAIVWQKGETLSQTDGAGHIAIVEQINDDGSIVLSESGWNCAKPFWTSTMKPPYAYGTGYKLLGFIYQPDTIKTEPAKTETKQEIPSGIIKQGMNGTAVKWLQTKLYEKGYLRKTEIDGDFGKITEGAVLAYKADNGLLAVCGDDVKEMLNK